MKKAVVIGAGKTGRGFIGRLLQQSGVEIIFLDKNKELVDALNAQKSFSVSFFGSVADPVTVDHYKAYTWENAYLEDATLIFVSVCGQNLPDVGAALAGLLYPERKYHIITCENASHPAQTLNQAIGKNNVAVSEATVFCTTIEAQGLDISSENYPYLQCNAQLLEGFVPDVPSIKTIDNFDDFLTRKLFTYNAASCVIAYIGALLGYTDYGAAANDPMVLALLDKNYAATNAAMCKAFGYEEQDQREFAALSKAKFCDRTITDTVARNAREPHRKLAAGERIIGAAALLHQYGQDASVLELTAAAALLYNDPTDKTWSAIKAENSSTDILKTLCSLKEEDALYQNITTYLAQLTADPQATIANVF